jgi:hypothetical protein
MRTVSDSLRLDEEEQLPIWHEDFLTPKPRRLEDIPQFSWTITSPTLDHRRHSPTEWLWWMHKVPNEVHIPTAGHMEDIRWLSMVAPQFKVQRAQR